MDEVRNFLGTFGAVHDAKVRQLISMLLEQSAGLTDEKINGVSRRRERKKAQHLVKRLSDALSHAAVFILGLGKPEESRSGRDLLLEFRNVLNGITTLLDIEPEYCSYMSVAHYADVFKITADDVKAAWWNIYSCRVANDIAFYNKMDAGDSFILKYVRTATDGAGRVSVEKSK